MSDVRILVVDDNALMRVGLSETISIEPNFTCVGAAGNAEIALEMVRELRPDVVTMDYKMPGKNGVECSRDILAEFPETKILLLSVFDKEEEVWQAVQAGVKGYLPKNDGEIEEVIEAINEIADGGTYFPAYLAQKIEFRETQTKLSKREMEMLKLLAKGMSNQEIGDAMDMSLPNVKFNMVNLRKKLGAIDRTQALVIALKRGLISLDESALS